MNQNEKIIAKHCGYRKTISGTRIHMCRLWREPCENVIKERQCPLINERTKKGGDSNEA